MSTHKTICLLTVLSAVASLTINTAIGQEWSSASFVTNQTPVLEASLKNEEIVGSEQVRRAYVTFGTNTFAFVVPSNFRMDASNSDKIVLVNQEADCFLTFRIVDAVPAQMAEKQTEYYRALLAERYPDANTLDEFYQSAANNSGPAFDLQWRNSNSVTQAVRTAFIPSAAGVLEFSLLAPSTKFEEGRSFFNSFLLLFRSNENGKLEIARLSDKI
jgi:hypothetical protein